MFIIIHNIPCHFFTGSESRQFQSSRSRCDNILCFENRIKFSNLNNIFKILDDLISEQFCNNCLVQKIVLKTLLLLKSFKYRKLWVRIRNTVLKSPKKWAFAPPPPHPPSLTHWHSHPNSLYCTLYSKYKEWKPPFPSRIKATTRREGERFSKLGREDLGD